MDKILETKFLDYPAGTSVTTIRLSGGTFRTEARYRNAIQGSYPTGTMRQAFKAHQLATEIIWETYLEGKEAS